MEQLETLLSQKNYDFDEPYEDKDYEGEFNLLKNEKEFIKKSTVKNWRKSENSSFIIKN